MTIFLYFIILLALCNGFQRITHRFNEHSLHAESKELSNVLIHTTTSSHPQSPSSAAANEIQRFKHKLLNIAIAGLSTQILSKPMVFADDSAVPAIAPTAAPVDWGSFRLPYNHENLEWRSFLGKVTIFFNMKIDDPQTVTQFPSLAEIYNKYKDQGLHVQGFPTEQGWFEPDDDETCREKSKVYYGFGDYPGASIFDKVSYLAVDAIVTPLDCSSNCRSTCLVLARILLSRHLPKHCPHRTVMVGLLSTMRSSC
jgi:hypothetical protein